MSANAAHGDPLLKPEDQTDNATNFSNVVGAKVGFIVKAHPIRRSLDRDGKAPRSRSLRPAPCSVDRPSHGVVTFGHGPQPCQTRRQIAPGPGGSTIETVAVDERGRGHPLPFRADQWKAATDGQPIVTGQMSSWSPERFVMSCHTP